MEDNRIDLNLNFIVGKGGTGKSLFAELLHDSLKVSGRDEVVEIFSDPYRFPHVIPNRGFMTLNDLGRKIQDISTKEAIWELATIDLHVLSDQYDQFQFSNAEWISLGLKIRFWLMISSDFGSLYVAAKIINQFAHHTNFTLVLNDTAGDETTFINSREALVDLFNDKGWGHFLEPSLLREQDQHRLTEESALQFLQTFSVVYIPYLPLYLRRLTNYTQNRPTIRSISQNQNVSSMDQSRAGRFLQKANAQIISAL